MTAPWSPPLDGDFVWCMFPELPDLQPGPKPRPALVIETIERVDGWQAVVVPGTSQHTTALHRAEVAIYKGKNPAAFAQVGLSFDTKFDFKAMLTLPWTERYFKVPPHAPHGQRPLIGTLHPTLMRAFAAAYQAAQP